MWMEAAADQLYEDEEMASFLLDLIMHEQPHGEKYDGSTGIPSETSGAWLFSLACISLAVNMLRLCKHDQSCFLPRRQNVPKWRY